jgi:hypothetical protein
MSDTRLILHVKGTEADTQELPREDVKSAVAEGRLSYSQLIWSPAEQAWKQVRDLPDLMPGESLILHVKGTESETRELPKQAVKNAIARGEITHSQLIWSTSDSSWKPVREIPELLPGETMIVHVKGTEAETRELPKPAIRAAIQRGEISQSQLIWSPLDSAWKPVSQMPELQPGESLILHVKGTTADTKEMPKKAIRTAIKEGQITHSQLIWSADEHQWKQVRELPELLPSQKLAPAPARRAQVPVLDSSETEAPQVAVARVPTATPSATPRARPAVQGPPRVTIAGSSASGSPQPRIAQPALAVGQAAGGQPATAAPKAVPVAKAAPPSAETRAAMAVVPGGQGQRPVAARAAELHAAGKPVDHRVHEHDDGFHPVKWVCIIVGVILALDLTANYLMVDRPFKSAFEQGSYANVFTYAHYGAFVQPSVMVIHIPRTDKLTADNLADFLVALAQSTPKNMITNDYFERVALTSGWTAQYSFPGSAWKSLGDMKGQSAEDIRTQILSNGSDAGGRSLLGESTMNDDAQEAQRNQAWQQIVANFCQPHS